MYTYTVIGLSNTCSQCPNCSIETSETPPNLSMNRRKCPDLKGAKSLMPVKCLSLMVLWMWLSVNRSTLADSLHQVCTMVTMTDDAANLETITSWLLCYKSIRLHTHILASILLQIASIWPSREGYVLNTPVLQRTYLFYLTHVIIVHVACNHLQQNMHKNESKPTESESQTLCTALCTRFKHMYSYMVSQFQYDFYARHMVGTRPG